MVKRKIGYSLGNLSREKELATRAVKKGKY
jgi:hypothetical protein